MDVDEVRLKEIQQELGASARAVLQQCPRFRILVTGKSGVGKTSLIRRTFGVEHLEVSGATPVRHDINSPIGSPTNPYFIVHDSQGFEYGSLDNQQIVLQFIKDRNKQPLLKDKLHAIWLCVAVPFGNGRPFEAADIEILKLKIDVPVIVIFTKYDTLVDRFVYKLEVEDEVEFGSDEELVNEARNLAANSRKKLCEEPLRLESPSDLPKPYPFTYVSTKKGYESSIPGIGKITLGEIASSVWLIWAVAQRANADINIEESIRMGRDNYWKGLRSDTVIGHKFSDWLVLIHRDIVKVWNFEDPNKYLESEPLMALMSHIVADLAVPTQSNPVSGSTLLANTATVVSTVIPHVAPFAVGFAGFVLAANWTKDQVKINDSTLCRLMGYIIDLTIVMQSVFGLLNHDPGAPAPVTRRLVNRALKAYTQSSRKTQAVHSDIRAFVSKSTTWQRFDIDHVVAEITRLIDVHRFAPGEQYVDRVAISDSESAVDEPWLRPEDL